MEESSTYRALHERSLAEGLAKGRAEGHAEGRADGLRRAVLDFLDARLGKVPVRTGRALRRLDADALDALFKQLLRATDEGEIRALLPKG